MTALRRNLELLRRAERAQARADTRAAMHDRRARTRRLIELGGLVAKSRTDELIALCEQDMHAALLGALLELADDLEQHPAPDRVVRWRDRGRQALREG